MDLDILPAHGAYLGISCGIEFINTWILFCLRTEVVARRAVLDIARNTLGMNLMVNH